MERIEAEKEVKRQWYVLRSVSGKEAKVKEYIETEVGHGIFGTNVSQVLIPTEKVFQVRNGKRVVKERPYLPGYVLIEAKLVGETAHMLRNTPNVMGFLGGMENPSPLTQAEVNHILGNEEEIQEEVSEVPFIEGEAVKVIEGPFSGFTGVIEKVNNEKKKLTVTVKVFGRNTPLDLSFMQVEKE